MRYIIGLGNPEKKYALTRHNAGFFVVDKIRDEFSFADFKINKKLGFCFSRGEIKNIPVILLKPQVFMNESGKAVKNLLNYFKILPADIIVIHDDIDLPLGKNKTAFDSGSAGHNGVQDIMDKIGTKKFSRFRIGVANDKIRSRIDPANFVLQKFPPAELEALINSLPAACGQLVKILAINHKNRSE